MPRYMSKDAEYLYRVVVTTTWAANEDRGVQTSSQVYGSYSTLQAAKTQATRHKQYDDWYTYRSRKRTTTATVQRTTVEWEDVEEK